MSKKIKVLFMHQNFPGQYRSLAPELNKLDEYNVRSLSIKEEGKIKGINDQGQLIVEIKGKERIFNHKELIFIK